MCGKVIGRKKYMLKRANGEIEEFIVDVIKVSDNLFRETFPTPINITGNDTLCSGDIEFISERGE